MPSRRTFHFEGRLRETVANQLRQDIRHSRDELQRAAGRPPADKVFQFAIRSKNLFGIAKDRLPIVGQRAVAPDSTEKPVSHCCFELSQLFADRGMGQL
jgi:hypothetical protein